MTRHHLLIILCAALLPAFSATADEAIADAQRALAAQGFYFGKADGRVNDETRAAVKRFQIRTGLQITGELDATTLRQLKAEPSPAPAESSDSLREIARTQEKSDREFLRRTEGAESADDPASPPRTALPPPRAPEPATKPERRAEVDVQRFVEDYLAAAEGSTPDKEMSFYAERVDYFDSGRVSRDFVRDDQIRYYRRWPERKFEMIGEPEIEWIDAEHATARFKLRFALASKSKRANGMTENFLTLRADADGVRIIGIRERRSKK